MSHSPFEIPFLALSGSVQTVIDWLERRIGWLAIPYLSAALITGQLTSLLIWQVNPAMIANWLLAPDEVLQNGEWWRLILFVFISPPNLFIGLFTIWCAWLVLRPLELYWGAFRFNLYLFISVLSTIGFALIANQVASNIWIQTSVLFAFCYVFPDVEFRVFFIFPIKCRYLALVLCVFHIFEFATAGTMARISMICGLANFFIFFGYEIVTVSWKSTKHAHRAAQFKRGFKVSHRCTVCGITEKDDPQIEFRYCSQCAEQREYCELHLRNHEHSKPPTPSVKDDAPTSVA